jgi:hypothetical protein
VSSIGRGLSPPPVTNVSKALNPSSESWSIRNELSPPTSIVATATPVKAPA